MPMDFNWNNVLNKDIPVSQKVACNPVLVGPCPIREESTKLVTNSDGKYNYYNNCKRLVQFELFVWCDPLGEVVLKRTVVDD